MIERAIVKFCIGAVLIIVLIAVLSMGACGTIYGLGCDIKGAAKGMAAAGHEVTKDKE